MHNMPDDVRQYDTDPRSPFCPDPEDMPTVTLCWCCDKPESQCECSDGFDPREGAYCDFCAGDCGDCNYEFKGGDK